VGDSRGDHANEADCFGHHSVVLEACDRHLTKVRRFGWFLVAQEKKDQTTSDNDQNAADPNQFRRHKMFLSGKLCSFPVAVLPCCRQHCRCGLTTLAYSEGR
jgi:hypothetical protein